MSPLLLVAALGAMTAPTPGPGVSYQAPAPDRLSVQVMNSYARCVVSSDPGGAETYVVADYRAPEFAPALRRYAIGHRDCLRYGKLQFQPIVFTGDMAEALMKRRHIGARALERAAANPDPHMPAGVPMCVVEHEPGLVGAVLATAPASAEEARAIDALKPAIGECTAKGRTLAANYVGMRAVLAVAAYRLSASSPATAPAGQ